ncbi:MAG: hypothetical protein ASARMPREDX12_005949 [Alectoria sarmentosa]|nr:MAG: hypothetical protein ASARMPREDX12_005949 [Alectoria sarmentosa]
MLLPLPILWSLHTGPTRKIKLTGFFFCAYCVIACSLGRLVAIGRASKGFEEDWTWDTITFYYWSAAELAISIVSISLPNMTQLFRRAHQHGISALFTRREYAASMGSGSKRGPGGSALAQGGKGGFQRIIGSDDTSFAVNQDPLITPKDQSASYTVSACAQQPEERELIALDQVHLRQDIDVREEERWPMV